MYVQTTHGLFFSYYGSHHTARVSSDNAMLDTGERTVYHIWRHDLSVTTDYVCVGSLELPAAESEQIAGNPALAPVYAAIRRYIDAKKWLQYVCREIARAEYELKQPPKVGDYVDVIKGRKAPKGTYRIEMREKSRYGGWCYTLVSERTAASPGFKYYYHISEGNCVLHPGQRPTVAETLHRIEHSRRWDVAATSDTLYPQKYHALFAAIASESNINDRSYFSREGKVAMAALADALAEDNHPYAEATLAHYRAFALSKVLDVAPNWPPFRPYIQAE